MLKKEAAARYYEMAVNYSYLPVNKHYITEH